jgi:uncharacterized membrane protein
VIVFGLFGAILVGLGLILIIAHNWDNLSRFTKTIVAFVPLVAGQLLCAFALLKKSVSVSWRESAAAFLFFAIGSSISMISQIYNIPGNISSFILTWMLLALPLIYLMKSSIISIFYLIGITYYACEVGYFSHFFSSSDTPYVFWVLILLALPHYYLLLKHKPNSNFTAFHNWIIPVSVAIVLGTVIRDTHEFMSITYFSLFGVLYLIGHHPIFTQQKLRNNGYKILGALGTIVLMLAFSFDWFWEDLRSNPPQLKEVFTSLDYLPTIILTLLAFILLYLNIKSKPIKEIKPLEPFFILFIITFIIGLNFSFVVVLMNFFVLATGILTIREGANQNHLGILNYGLLIITALVICRFFDSNISFVIRGLLFVTVGVGFFATNYWMLKKRKKDES